MTNEEKEKLLKTTKEVLNRKGLTDLDDDLFLKILEESIVRLRVEHVDSQLNIRERYVLRDFLKERNKKGGRK